MARLDMLSYKLQDLQFFNKLEAPARSSSRTISPSP